MSAQSAASAFELAVSLRHSGQTAEAWAALQAIIDEQPQHGLALHELGTLAQEAEDLDSAEAWFARAARAEPGQVGHLLALGRILLKQSRHPEAIRVLQQALRLNRTDPEILTELSAAHQQNDDLAEAEHGWSRVLALRPRCAEAHLNRGLVRRRLFKLGEALQDFDSAIKWSTDDPGRAVFTHTMKALTLLSMGDWAQGWREYEWRLNGSMRQQASTFDSLAPRWDGTPMPGETLLVYAEQGLGDTLNFCRYLKFPMLLGMRVVLYCPAPLVSLIQHSFGPAVLVTPGPTLPRCAAQIPLLSMPLAVSRHVGFEIPEETPYLAAPPERVAFFRGRLETMSPERRRIAIAWRGNPANSTDAQRSIDPMNFAPLLDPGADYFIIQPGADDDAFRALGLTNVYDLTGDITDFSDTAAAITALDGLISVDTSVAHLAGALRKPLWVLLAFHTDWRWGLLAETTPWYPGAQLYRQPHWGDWAPALVKLGADHQRWLQQAL